MNQLVCSDLAAISGTDFHKRKGQISGHRQCEIDLDRPSVMSERDEVPRDEILRRWSRARQRMQEAIRQA